MSHDFGLEMRNMAVAGGFTLLAAVPFLIVTFLSARAPLLTRWSSRRSPWNGFEILLFFLGLQIAVEASISFLREIGLNADPTQLRLVAMTLVTPMTILVAWLQIGYPLSLHPRLFAGRLALGTLAAMVTTPVVIGVNFLAILAGRTLGREPDVHPLSALGIGSEWWAPLLFAVGACVVTPIAEEFLFRGLMVRWAAERRYRPWCLMGFAAVFAFLSPGQIDDRFVNSLILLGLIGVGLFAIQRWGVGRLPVRMLAGIVSSAAVFAAAHAAVWPTPIPLFVLGLVLGYLTARTGGITASVALHGWFNAVSFVYLLRE